MSKKYKVKLLKDIDGIRQVPSMYIGSCTDGSGLNKIFTEVLDNSVDEYLSGFCTKIEVCQYEDKSVSVFDNGRGLPCHQLDDKTHSIEGIMTKLHCGGKFDKENYNVSGGLHGIGISAACALSERMLAVAFKENGKEYSMRFERGKVIQKLQIKKSTIKGTGTLIRFVPDLTIFKDVTEHNPKFIKEILLTLSFLCPQLKLTYKNEDTKEEINYVSENGLGDYVRKLSPSELISDPIMVSDMNGDIEVNTSFQWLKQGYAEIAKYFTNNIQNTEGGMHQQGFRNAITRTINSYITNSDLPKTLKIQLSGEDVREGLISVVSIKHRDPKFNSQTKTKLVSEDARTAVESVISSNLMSYLEQNPLIAKKVVTNCVNSYKAREAARKARETVRKSAIAGAGCLPGKLADCREKDPSLSELLLVEGQSAGGSVKQARNSSFQAVLALKGKILNVEKSDVKKMLSSEEITNIITVIGAGIGKNFDVEKSRYHKIILMMDSDVDGLHIRALILTFIMRQLPALIQRGYIYIAQSPLYKLNYRGKTHYLLDDKHLESFVKENKIVKGQGKLKLQRFKGLGEISAEDLWNTTVNPETRKLLQIYIGNPIETDKIFSLLMGHNVEPRRQFIIDNALKVNNLDI